MTDRGNSALKLMLFHKNVFIIQKIKIVLVIIIMIQTTTIIMTSDLITTIIVHCDIKIQYFGHTHTHTHTLGIHTPFTFDTFNMLNTHYSLA